mmetsp:Transcript_394/g.738  ORF Transcript_394/g.738 Transcript_394/m.738 type:complete len:294 (+) Transcript_394:65-946(+)
MWTLLVLMVCFPLHAECNSCRFSHRDASPYYYPPKEVDVYPKSFVVISQPRSGTHFLIDMLNLNPQVLCHGEVFSPAIVETDFMNITVQARDNNRTDIIRKLFRCTSKKKHGCNDQYDFNNIVRNEIQQVGFKVFTRQFNYHQLRILGMSNNVYKIVLFRKNAIDGLVSLHKARKYNTWMHNDTTNEKMRMPIDWLESYIKYNNEFMVCMRTMADASQNTEKWVFLTYEDLYQDTVGVMSKVFRFLNVDDIDNLDVAMNTISSTKQDRTVRSRDKLKNADEIEAKFGSKIFDP